MIGLPVAEIFRARGVNSAPVIFLKLFFGYIYIYFFAFTIAVERKQRIVVE